MSREGNYANGERNGRARWSDGDVELVRQLHDDGVPTKVIAEKMEMSVNTVKLYVFYRRRRELTNREG